MKKTENLRGMIEGRIADLEKQIARFDPALSVPYSAYEHWIDENYRTVTVGKYAFAPSDVMKKNLDTMSFHYDFVDWARGLDKEEIPEYIQMVDELELNKQWLEELK